jgi:hypothetical protein
MKSLEKWKRIKSNGRKRYVLKSLLLYEFFVLLIGTVYLMLDEHKIFTNIPKVTFVYLCMVIIYLPLGIWIGNNSWNANIRRFEK